MKKTYIKPENTVVRLNTETMIAQSNPQYNPDQSTTATSGNLAREVIQAPDAWEEW